jgi:hypothetical protein
MTPRASLMLPSGAATIALALLLPVSEVGPRLTPLFVAALAVPWLALVVAIRLPQAAWSHGVFPLSLLPAVIHVPELHAHPGWSGVGGLLSLIAVAVAFGAFLRAAALPPATPPLRLRVRPAPTPTFAHVLAVLLVIGPVMAIWWPFLAAPEPPPATATALAAAFSLAVTVVVLTTAERLDFTTWFFDRAARRHAVATHALDLRRRRRRAIVGLALASLTALAGLAWYLRRGFA